MIKNIIKQTDPRLPKSVQRYGCRVMCLLAIPQIVSRTALSIHAVESILLHAAEDPDIAGKNWRTGSREHWLIEEVFRRLGVKRKGRQVAWNDDMLESVPWEYMITHWRTRGPDGHFTLFDRGGIEIYDPHEPAQAGRNIEKIDIIKRLGYRTWEG